MESLSLGNEMDVVSEDMVAVGSSRMRVWTSLGAEDENVDGVGQAMPIIGVP